MHRHERQHKQENKIMEETKVIYQAGYCVSWEVKEGVKKPYSYRYPPQWGSFKYAFEAREYAESRLDENEKDIQVRKVETTIIHEID